jgi:hypothetical protein
MRHSNNKLKNITALIILFAFFIPYISFAQQNNKVVEVKVKPNPPALNPVTTPTNQTTQLISGTKESDTSVWLNGREIWLRDLATEWHYEFNLSERENPISLTSKNKWNKESEPTISSIFLDTQAPNITIISPKDGEWFGRE